MKTLQCNNFGFSLVEMAIVLVIVSLMLGGLMMSLSQTRESTRRSDAKALLAQVEEALHGFAQANGRLPCPAVPTSSGLEDPLGGGVCARQHGFVPSATLGLKGAVNADGLFLDPWNNPLRYSVTTANARAFTTANSMKTVTMAGLAPDLRIFREAANINVIANTIPAVVVSMGNNWATFPPANVDEWANAGEGGTVGGGPSGATYRIANNNDFVSANYSENYFDDLITWISPHILYTRMISAGQLP